MQWIAKNVVHWDLWTALYSSELVTTPGEDDESSLMTLSKFQNRVSYFLAPALNWAVCSWKTSFQFDILFWQILPISSPIYDSHRTLKLSPFSSKADLWLDLVLEQSSVLGSKCQNIWLSVYQLILAGRNQFQKWIISEYQLSSGWEQLPSLLFKLAGLLRASKATWQSGGKGKKDQLALSGNKSRSF